jgi:hypothetical protein
MWYRVFGSNDHVPGPAGIEGCLAGPGTPVSARFAADEAGWYRAELSAGPGPPLVLERWLADEEGIRAELNSWAAVLEACEDSPHARPLMERAIQTRQLFTLSDPAARAPECLALCRHLARVTDGFYQADGQGFFAADGTLLVPEWTGYNKG